MRSRLVIFSILIAGSLAAEPPATSAPPPPAATPLNGDDLYQAGKQLFDQFAPPEIKQQYDFPSKDQITDFMAGLQRSLDNGTLEELAGYEDQAAALLGVLRTVPAYADDADWLSARLQEIDEAKKITSSSRPAAPTLPPSPTPRGEVIPYYADWILRERGRAAPANAASLMPQLRRAFAAEGVPPEVAWLAEVESSLRPSARSPSGARGLFQLKADTAHDLGTQHVSSG